MAENILSVIRNNNYSNEHSFVMGEMRLSVAGELKRTKGIACIACMLHSIRRTGFSISLGRLKATDMSEDATIEESKSHHDPNPKQESTGRQTPGRGLLVSRRLAQ